MDGTESEQTEQEKTAAIFDASLQNCRTRYPTVYGDVNTDTLLLIRKIGLTTLNYSDEELKKTATVLDTGITDSPEDDLFLGTRKDETDMFLGEDERQTFAHTKLLEMYQIDSETNGEEFASSALRGNVADRLFRLESLREPYQKGRYTEVRLEPQYRQNLGLLRSALDDIHTALHPSQSSPPYQPSE
jgi:hypothetical protein